MGYYTVKINIDTGEVNKRGEPIVTKCEYLVDAMSIYEAESLVAYYMQGSQLTYETVQITKSKIDCVILGKDDYR